MKFVIVIFMIITTAYSVSVNEDEIKLEEHDEDYEVDPEKLKIVTGVSGKQPENLHFCKVVSEFISKTQQCGGLLVDSGYVLTSPRCVTDCVEASGGAQYGPRVSVNCGRLTSKSKTKVVDEIIVPTGKNGATFTNLPTLKDPYVPCDDKRFGVISNGSYVALLKLSQPYTSKELDRSVKVADLSTDATVPTLSPNQAIRVCGYGADNKGKFTTSLKCANMNPISTEMCRNQFANFRVARQSTQAPTTSTQAPTTTTQAPTTTTQAPTTTTQAPTTTTQAPTTTTVAGTTTTVAGTTTTVAATTTTNAGSVTTTGVPNVLPGQPGFVIPDNTLCLWSNEGNLCRGDFGGPAQLVTFANEKKKKVVSQKTLCINIGSPNFMGRGQTCSSGHTVICQPVAGNVTAWINGVKAQRFVT